MKAGDCKREICRFPTVLYRHAIVACDHGCPYKDECRFYLPLPKTREEMFITDEEAFARMIHGEDGEE